MLLRLHTDRPRDKVIIDWLLSLHDMERHDIVRDILYREATGGHGAPAVPLPSSPAQRETTDTTDTTPPAPPAEGRRGTPEHAIVDTTADIFEMEEI